MVAGFEILAPRPVAHSLSLVHAAVVVVVVESIILGGLVLMSAFLLSLLCFLKAVELGLGSEMTKQSLSSDEASNHGLDSDD